MNSGDPAAPSLGPLGGDAGAPLDTLVRDLAGYLGGLDQGARCLRERAEAIGNERLGWLAARVLENTARMSAFVRDSVGGRRFESGLPLAFETFDMGEVAAEVVEQFQETARRKAIAVRLARPAADIAVVGDRAALGQVLVNLLSNAVKFSPRGKTVWIRVGPAPEGGGQCVIRDEGPGFNRADRAHLFERFRSLSGKPTGGETSTGLGLSIAHRLMQGMSGSLACVSAPESGARFVVTLPTKARH
jgi:signal transduction histidine kinase